MPQFRSGQVIRIPVEVQKGAFPTEYLITFEAADRPVSGFVPKDSVEDVRGETGYIRGVIRDVSADIITVMVRGSFFTTTGLAQLKRDWANKHVEPTHA